MRRARATGFFVYMLLDPATGRRFYVGKGKVQGGSYRNRLTCVIGEARGGKRGPKYDTVRGILARDELPTLAIVLKTQDEAEAFARERALISELGGELDNVAVGGPGHGAEHWTRTHPERVLRGAAHPFHKHPELLAAAQERFRNWPLEKRCRGDSHGMTKITDAQVLEIRARYATGTVQQTTLAGEFGVSITAIGRILRGGRGGVAMATRPGNAKLTPADKIEIRRRLAAGEQGSTIARDFNVSGSLVSYIKHHDVEIVPTG